MSRYYKSIYKELEEDFEKELEELKKSQKQKEKQLVGIIDLQSKEYSYKFTKTFKERIKKRDNNQCQFPGCKAKNDLTVHHIDYNKKNCQDKNCITLCRGHNSFVNKISERKEWEEYFTNLMHYKINRG